MVREPDRKDLELAQMVRGPAKRVTDPAKRVTDPVKKVMGLVKMDLARTERERVAKG